MMARRVWSKGLWPWVLGAGLVVAMLGLQRRQLTALQVPEPQSLVELQLQDERDRTQLRLLRQLPTFGYDNMIANWTFLNFLQYFGNVDVRDVVGYQISPDFFEVIVTHDPLFLAPYSYLTTSVSMYAAFPKTSIALLERGLERMAPGLPPYSFYMWRFKGIEELLFLGDGQAAQQSFSTAAEWARQVDSPEALAIADISQQTADFLTEDIDSLVARINAWTLVLVRAVDDDTRARAVAEIEALGGTVISDGRGHVVVRHPPSPDQTQDDSESD